MLHLLARRLLPALAVLPVTALPGVLAARRH
jgi:hypothetical protein